MLNRVDKMLYLHAMLISIIVLNVLKVLDLCVVCISFKLGIWAALLDCLFSWSRYIDGV